MKNINKNYYLAGIAALLLLTRLGLGSIFTSASDITPQSVSAGVNNERSTRNIPTLNYNSDLAAAAAYKAQDMVTRSYFAHQDPQGNFIWPTDVADGYTPYTILGENLAINFPDTDSLMSAWMDSPEHRTNILNPAFQDQGAGVASGNASQGQYSISIANEFGALAVAQKAPVPTPKPQPTPKPAATPVPVAPTKPAPKSTPAPPVTPSPTPSSTLSPAQPTPAPVSLPEVALVSDDQTGNGSNVVLGGTATPNSSIIVSDTAFPNVGHVEVTSGASGSFAHEFTNLANGTHVFVAVLADGSATSAPYSVDVSTSVPAAVQAAATAALNAPTVNAQSLHLTAFALGTGTALDVSVNVGGNVVSVSASVNGQSASLAGGPASYSGTVLLPEHTGLAGQSIVVTATGADGKTGSASAPLDSVPVQQTASTGGVGNADLYGVFKGIAVLFGIIFAIFLIGDLIHSIKNRGMTAEDIIKGSHIAVLLIAVGTMLLVSWWH